MPCWVGWGRDREEGSHFASRQSHKALASPAPTAATDLSLGRPARPVLPSPQRQAQPSTSRHMGLYLYFTTEGEKTVRGKEKNKQKNGSDCKDDRWWERPTGPALSFSHGPPCPQCRWSIPSPPTLLTGVTQTLVWHFPKAAVHWLC